MNENKNTISQAESYREIAEFWDAHSLAEFWEQTEPVEFKVDIQSEATYYPLERQLSQQLAQAAYEHGVSAETLLNIWIQEKLAERPAPGP